ncbi:hypothetical protein [Shewanella sp. NIFS-20-20]|uniref:hypothetical protein n=1 Tax=Shewanella sp. NIFS-20-20 TaxID=2853806 RepID=UPI001C489807|nr:hypothetical protein [Shewanella sp. NIFS-20-20]MBV7314966.1 hypothetical protein [Shewanella sp. NIFS-20-20]
MIFVKSARYVGALRLLLAVIGFLMVWLIASLLLDVLTGRLNLAGFGAINISADLAYIMVWFASILPILMLLSTLIPSFNLIVNGGQWRINLDEHGLTWVSPCTRYEASFHFALTQVECIVVVQGRSPIQRRQQSKHLMLKDGSILELKTYSLINLDKIYDELVRLGIPVRVELPV